MKEKGYSFQVLFVGEGKDRPKIEKAIVEEQLEEYCQLLGLRKDVPQLCNAAHALLMPSLFEGLPISLLEAGASGLPVIATPVGSIPTLLDADTGYLINHTSQLTDTMRRVMTNYEEAKRRGKKLQKRINQEYDIQAIVEKHENIYYQLYHNK